MNIDLHEGDLPANVQVGGSLAIDTEAMGLQWGRDRLCLVQMKTAFSELHLVRFKADDVYRAPRLQAILADTTIIKIIHFARFDMGILKQHLGVMPQNVYCTKIASFLARTYTDRHGLKELCKELLGVELSKEQQSSDWGNPELSPDQLKYAAQDVIHLHDIKNKLDAMLIREKRDHLLQPLLNALPARVELDLAGWAEQDIFAHH